MEKILFLIENQAKLDADKLFLVKELMIFHEKKIYKADSTLDYSIYVMLNIIKEERHVELVCSCIKVIKQIILSKTVIYNIIPGILSTIVVCIVKNYGKMNRNVVIESLQLLELCLSKNDRVDDVMSQKVHFIMQQLKILRGHLNSKVRMAYFELSKSLINSGQYKESIPILIGNIVLGCQDEVPEVEEFCQNVFINLNSDVINNEFICCEFDNLVDSFYLLMTGFNEEEKKQFLKLLSGYLKASFNKKVKLSSLSMDKLMKNLIRICVFDLSNVKWIQEKSLIHHFDFQTPFERLNVHENKLFHRFIYLNDDTLINHLNSLIYYFVLNLFNANDMNQILAYLDYEEYPDKSSSLLYILNTFLNNQELALSKEQEHVYESIFCRLINLPILNYPSSIKESEFCTKDLPSKSISIFNQIILEKHCILQSCTRIVILTSSSNLLNVLLYPLLENLGDFNLQLHDRSYICLASLTFHFKAENIPQLFSANFIYLLNTTSFKLRSLGSNIFTPKVLFALINVLDYSIVPFFKDISLELFDALDKYRNNDYILLSILRVFKEFVSIVKCELELEATEDVGIARVFRDKEYVDDFILDSETNQQEDSEAKITVTPDSFAQTCLSILLKLQYFLSIDNPIARSMVYEILGLILQRLENIKEYQESNSQVLKWLHQSFPILIQRLKNEQEPYIVNSLVTLITRISVFASSFFSLKYIDNYISPILDSALGLSQPLHKTVGNELNIQSLIMSDISGAKNDIEDNLIRVDSAKDFEGSNNQLKLILNMMELIINISAAVPLQMYQIEHFYSLFFHKFIVRHFENLSVSSRNQVIQKLRELMGKWYISFPGWLWFKVNIVDLQHDDFKSESHIPLIETRKYFGNALPKFVVSVLRQVAIGVFK